MLGRCLGDAGCAWLHSPRGGPVTQVSSEDPAHPSQTPPSLVWGMAWTGSHLGEERAEWVQGRPRAFLGGVYEKSPGSVTRLLHVGQGRAALAGGSQCGPSHA